MRFWTQWMRLPHCLICNLLKKDRVDHNFDRLFFTHRKEVIFMEIVIFLLENLFFPLLVAMLAIYIDKHCENK